MSLVAACVGGLANYADLGRASGIAKTSHIRYLAILETISEVKAAATVGARDFRGLRSLAAGTGESFASGVVLYTGTEVVPFGGRLFAVPFAALWE